MKKRKDKYGRVLKEGEGLRKDGLYQYRYNGIDGKRKTVYAKTLDALREKEQEIHSDIYNGFCNTDKGITVDQMFARCAANRQFLKPRSREVYEYCYNKHAKPVIGAKKMCDIKYSDMVLYFKYLANEQHLSLSSMRSIYHSLTPLFKMALRDGIIKIDPIDGVFAEIRKMYQLTPNKRNAVSQENLNKLANFIADSRKDSKYLNIFLTLALTGMRVSELCGLMRQDIDFENETISVERTIVYLSKENKKIVQTPKSESGIRQIPMMSKLKEILLEMYENQKDMPPITCGEYSGFVFGTKTGAPYIAKDVEDKFRNALKHYNAYETEQAKLENREPALIENCCPHSLRHSFCSLLCENDVNIKTIQEIMGHKNVATTINIYSEVSDTKKRNELRQIEEKFISIN